ncbi:hypothetical protein [Microbacterium saperdae]|uniref:hypothetical protein n=1 Tax=Microbacterium saperdae TaxID=69368 RepID=UPI00114FD946|nr:hypothetical protein [Microbacterium saperdae]GGM39363.1 hypothetical protein GCM10010489_08000 [Microbacterium saperdae]
MTRLSGDDSAVREVGAAAVKALGADPQAASALFSRLWKLHLRRARFVTSATAQPVSSSAAPPERESGALYRTVWGVLLGIGLVAALVQAVMLGPADRRNSFMDPSTALAVALVAGVIAIPALLIVLVLRVPDHKSARTGETLAVLVGLICGGILVFRLVVGGSDDRGFDPQDLVAWLPMTAVSVLLIIGIAVRSDLVRRRSVGPAPAGSAGAQTDSVREMRREAEWAASSTRQDATAKTDWLARLDQLGERGVDADSVAQARTMTPAAWLTWLAYDGEIDIAGVIPRP